MWRKANGNWIQMGPSLLPTDVVGQYVGFATSLSLSSDGTVAVIGGPNDNDRRGATWVAVRAGDQWVLQGKIVAAVEPGAQFGSGVALSPDAKQLVVGALGEKSGQGGIRTYTAQQYGSTTAVASSRVVSLPDESVTLSAILSSPGRSDRPAGMVTFFDGSTRIGTAVAVAGLATLTTKFSTPGTHRVTAAFDGTVFYAKSTSAPVVQQVVSSIPALSPTVVALLAVVLAFAGVIAIRR
jgi:hypothetical protein